MRHLPKATASKRNSTVSFGVQLSTLLTFFKFPKSSTRFRCVMSFALCNPVSHLGLLWHLCVTRPLRARAWTPVVRLHLSNPCAEPKGSLPNKTQRHETKSLGHYITLVQVRNFLLPLSFKVFQHKEREAQSFYADFSICLPQHVWHPPQGHCELAKVTLLLRTARLN